MTGSPSESHKKSWLLCIGMPKCGTTTLAAMLDANPHLAVHHQKEPNDFLKDLGGVAPKLSGYQLTERTRILVDFSTLYGLPGNRQRVLENLAHIGELERARFILALREPEALAESFFHHMLSRRSYDPERDSEELRRSIGGAVNFGAAISDLLERVTADRLFVTKLEDISSAPGQRRTIEAVSSWLDVAAVPPVERVQRNDQASARRYVPALEKLIMRLRTTDLGRRMPPQARRFFSSIVSKPAEKVAAEFDLERWVDPRIVSAASDLYRQLRTGPLGSQPIHREWVTAAHGS